MTALAKEWNSLPEADRSEYEDIYLKDKEKYDKAHKIWFDKYGHLVKKEKKEKKGK